MTYTDNMGITINDDDILNMPENLRVKLFDYLKEQRNLNHNRQQSFDHQNQNDSREYDDYGLKIIKKIDYPEVNAVFSEVIDNKGKFLGTKITQNGRTYIARDWSLTEEVKEIINLAINSGLVCFWRTGPSHPRDLSFEGNEGYLRGAHHIGFSFNTSQRYIFVLGAESRPKANKIREITFHKRMEPILRKILKEEISSKEQLQKNSWRKQNWGGHDLTTHPDDINNILNFIEKDRINNPQNYL